MMPQSKVSALFNRFAGRAVDVTETPHVYKSRSTGKETHHISATLSDTDPTIAELNDVAKANGLYTRIWLRNYGTFDWQPERLNVYIEKAADGKYRITDEFKLG